MRKLLFSVFCALMLCSSLIVSGIEWKAVPKFKAVAFFTAKNDRAHVSFVHEANRWFALMAARTG